MDHSTEQGNTMALATRPLLRIVALVVVAAAAFLIAWLVLKDDGNTSSRTATGAARTVSQAQLEDLAASTDHPVYWAGARDNMSYELTKTTDGRIFIRYLPPGVQAGDQRANFLAIGTYPRTNAFRDLQRASRRQGEVAADIGNGGLLVFNERKPTNVYFGYPNANYQVEVFLPSPQAARGLVLSGKIKPIP
jgi:hypothetical protein